MSSLCPYWKRGYCVADKACKFEHDPKQGGQLQETFLSQQKQQKEVENQPPMIPTYHHPVSAVSMASALYGGGQPVMYGYPYYGMMGVIGQPSAISSGIPKNYKTVQCRHFLRGHCMRGSSCGFRHGEDETSTEQAPESFGQIPAELANPIYPGRPFRVVTCRRWAQGNCTLGDRCTFKHDFDHAQHYQAAGAKRQLPGQEEEELGTSKVLKVSSDS